MAALLMKKYGADTVKRCFDEQWIQSSQEEYLQVPKVNRVNAPVVCEDEIMDMSLEEEQSNESHETKESAEESQESVEESALALESSSSSLNSEKKPHIVYKKTKLDTKLPLSLIEITQMPDLVKKIRCGEIASPTPSVKWTEGELHDPLKKIPQAILSYLALNGPKLREQIIASNILMDYKNRDYLIKNHLRELLEQGILMQ